MIYVPRIKIKDNTPKDKKILTSIYKSFFIKWIKNPGNPQIPIFPFKLNENLICLIARFIMKMIHPEYINRCVEILDSQIRFSARDSQFATSSANCISILNAIGYSFEGKNYDNVQIPGSNLSHALLKGTSLLGANLDEVNLSKACLAGASLDFATMKNIKFYEIPYNVSDSPILMSIVDHAKGFIISSCEDTTIKVWDIKGKGDEKWILKPHTTLPCPIQQELGHLKVNALLLLTVPMPENLIEDRTEIDLLIVGYSNGIIVRWDLNKNHYLGIENRTHDQSPITSLISIGKSFAFSTLNGQISIRDALSGKMQARLDNKEETHKIISKNFVFMAVGNHKLKFWAHCVNGGEWDMSPLRDTSLEKEFLADIEEEKMIQIRIETIMKYKPTVICRSDTHIVFAAPDDHSIHIWHINTLTQIASLKGHTKTVTGLSYDKNRKILISTSMDSTVRLWELKALSQIHTSERKQFLQSVDPVVKDWLDNPRLICDGVRINNVRDISQTNLLVLRQHGAK